MKRYALASTLAFLCALSSFALSENVAMWDTIYRKTEDYPQRASIMLKIMDLHDREFAPALAEYLDDVILHRIDDGSANEQSAKRTLASLIVRELGNLKAAESAESVHAIYADTADRSLKADAALALGKMRAVRYAPEFAADLASINLKPDPLNFRFQEIQALALVKALDAMRSIDGYEAVFLASVGWYSSFSRVRESARAALVTMVDDPTDSLTAILAGNPSLDVKKTALETALRTKASAERKAAVASRALELSLSRATNDAPSAAALSRLRVASLDALIALGDRTEGNVAMYSKVVELDRKNDATLEETLKAYMALGANGSDGAAGYLASRMAFYNERERSKANTVRDKSLIRQIAASMKASGNRLCRPPLVEAQFIDYDASILRAVADALETIPK